MFFKDTLLQKRCSIGRPQYGNRKQHTSDISTRKFPKQKTYGNIQHLKRMIPEAYFHGGKNRHDGGAGVFGREGNVETRREIAVLGEAAQIIGACHASNPTLASIKSKNGSMM